MIDEQINTEMQQLTTLQEVEENIAAGLESYRIVSDPYQIDGPIELMTREYLIFEQEVVDGALVHIRPIPLLFTQPTMVNYIKNFGLFRSNVCVRLEIVSNPMQYGLLEVSVLPTETDTDYITSSQLVQSNWLLLDIGEQESGELKIPFLRTKLYYTIGDNDDWRITVKPFISVITTTTPETVGLRVFAHLEDLELAMPISPHAVFQAGMGGPRRMSKTMKLIGGIATTVGAMYHTYTTGQGFVKIAEHINELQESSHVDSKMELLGDISTRGAKTSSEKRLGDDLMGATDLGTTLMDIVDIREICSLPTLISGIYFGNGATTELYDPNPLNYLDSYPLFVSRMFRFWRGSTKLYLRFCCSPMVSARFLIILYPDGDVSPGASALGDLPSWIVTVKGSLDWCLEIPYLQKETWQQVETQPIYRPRVGVSLMGTLPQPFDMPVNIFVRSYCSFTEDLQFAALQSNATPDTLLGDFQSIRNRMSDPITIGESIPVRYMGYNGTVLDIIKRYSDSKLPVVSNFYPYPKVPTTQEQLLLSDNFDYIPSLYKWYSGDVRCKFVFAEGTTSELLRVSIKNSKIPIVGGSKPVAGDSTAATTQAVWPVIDVVYPYMSQNPMNYILGPEPIYGLHIPQFQHLSQVLTAAAENFQLHYLMPVPSLPFLEGEEAVFQSLQPVPAFSSTWYNIFSLPTAGTDIKTITIPFGMFAWNLQVLCLDTLTPAPFMFAVFNTNNVPDPLNTPSVDAWYIASLVGKTGGDRVYQVSGASVYSGQIRWGVFAIDNTVNESNFCALFTYGPINSMAGVVTTEIGPVAAQKIPGDISIEGVVTVDVQGDVILQQPIQVEGFAGIDRIDRKSVV